MMAPNRTVWEALVALSATAFDVPVAEVSGPTRGPARAALARQLAYYLAVTTLGWTASDAALLSLVSSSLALLDVSVYWQDIIRGSILLAAVTIDLFLNKRRG